MNRIALWLTQVVGVVSLAKPEEGPALVVTLGTQYTRAQARAHANTPPPPHPQMRIHMRRTCPLCCPCATVATPEPTMRTALHSPHAGTSLLLALALGGAAPCESIDGNIIVGRVVIGQVRALADMPGNASARTPTRAAAHTHAR